MINKWRFSPGLVFLFDFLMCLGLVAFSNPAFAIPAFGAIKGTTLLGSPLEVTTTLTGLTEDQLTQFNAGCVEAKLMPTGHSDLVQVSRTQSLVAEFQMTQRGGGTLQLRSLYPVNDPVMQISFNSYCPTVLFSHTWTLLINPQRDERIVATAGSSGSDSPDRRVRFELQNSALLRASRVHPPALKGSKETEIASPSKLDMSVPDPALQFDNFDSAPPIQAVSSEPHPASTTEKVNNLPDSIRDSHLIESSARLPAPQNQPPQLNQNLEQKAEESLPWTWITLLIASAMTLMFAGVMWLRKRERKGVSSLEGSAGLDADQVSDENRSSGLELAFDDEFDSLEEPIDQSSSHLFQSFIGVPAENQAVEFDFTDERPRYDGMLDSNDPSELAISMVTRDEHNPWVLPSGYEPLVQQRNASIDKRRQTDSNMLRASLALVEYCHQSVIQMVEIQSNGVKRILGQLQVGDDALTAGEEGAVPDMLNSFVNEKMCRLDSAEQREHMIAQLRALTDHCEDYPICFHSSAWSEFLFQVGQEAMVN
ncbi:hypothetical protein [Limnobacter sp.]|uniref:type IV pilus assembly protein FimV n=1 Tax=Limnobacter sp. TaxID=2003368 RepID=UPI0025902974|nr:hypothetical protein [Limnobacter sp.]